MDRDSRIERQKLDCNCNDCIFLVRSFEHRQKHEDNHYKWQKNHFDSTRKNLLKKADEHILKGLRGECTTEESRDKQKALIKEAKNLTFQFDKGECSLSYGYCSLNGMKSSELKLVSFIPETLQLHTQKCFKHRRS